MWPMSAKIVRRAAACCPPANRATYSASAVLATTHTWYDGGEAVDESIDLSGSICVAQEEAATSDRASVRP